MAKRTNKPGFFYRNGLSIVMLSLALIFLAAQAYTGWDEHNKFLAEHGQPAIDLGIYLCTGHFLQATFENWESEFFQMALFVLLTVFLRQQGSSESKPIDEKDPVDRAPRANAKGAPWPVKKGGFILKLYEHSLSLALAVLFILSFFIHWYGSWKDHNLQQVLDGKPAEPFSSYISNNRFWFESFQNWQSEFISIAAIVILSIYLREKGSSQSKPVDAPHDENE